MPLASVCHYSDPEQFEADYHAADVELTQIGREPFEAHVARSELNNLWMVQVDDALSQINWATQCPDRVSIRFLTKPATAFVINDILLQSNEIVGPH